MEELKTIALTEGLCITTHFNMEPEFGPENLYNVEINPPGGCDVHAQGWGATLEDAIAVCLADYNRPPYGETE